MMFRPGQKVVCIAPAFRWAPGASLWRRLFSRGDPSKGRVYTVSSLRRLRNGCPALTLAEFGPGVAYSARAFRPAVEPELGALAAIANRPDAPLPDAPEEPRRETPEWAVVSGARGTDAVPSNPGLVGSVGPARWSESVWTALLVSASPAKGRGR